MASAGAESGCRVDRPSAPTAQTVQPSVFLQDPPRLGNQWEEDSALQSVLQRLLPQRVWQLVEPELRDLGRAVIEEAQVDARQCDRNDPVLRKIDAWGAETDEIITDPAWQRLQRFSARNGVVATGYDTSLGPYCRLVQLAKLYMFGPSCSVFTCYLAMTDGAAALARAFAAHHVLQQDKVYAGLTSRDPETFITSGQWMTERPGGSDIGRSETIAVPVDNGASYRLHGYKFFTSATTSEIAFTLARIADQDGGNATPGSRGLSMFYLRLRDASGHLNGIRITRLKEKLGTRSVPTAELELCGAKAYLVGEPGRGVPAIASMLNVTRMYNAVMSAAFMRRCIAMARDYAHRRYAFGAPLSQKPLHLRTLAEMEVRSRASLHLVADVARLLGRAETGDRQAARLARVLTPVAKLFTAKEGIAVCSEGVETFGGAGYMEDTGIPKFLRDAQVLSIWEGTTNVLSLDLLRALTKDAELYRLLVKTINERLSLGGAKSSNADVATATSQTKAALAQVSAYALSVARRRVAMPAVEANARAFAFAVARVYTASLLIEHACAPAATAADATTALRWCTMVPLVSIPPHTPADLAMDAALALDHDRSGQPRGCGDRDSSGRLRCRL